MMNMHYMHKTFGLILTVKRFWTIYHMTNLKTDTLLLADVLEKFRQMCINVYDLGPVHCNTAPRLSWDALLKLTKILLDLITDPDMLLMIEKGVFGGISSITHRYAKPIILIFRKHMITHNFIIILCI